MKSIRILLCLLVSMCCILFLGCSPTPPSSGDGGGGDTASKCAGERDCPCLPKATCDEGLECREGVCRSTEEQPDAMPDTKRKDCVAGTSSCRCTATGKCDSGLRCDAGVCQTCKPGTVGCACNKGKCDAGNICQDGVCTGCVGKEHCTCYGNGRCDAGLRCEESSTKPSICKSCDAGHTEGCNCEKDSQCGSFVCENKRCVDPKKINQIPQKPKCYTPCQGDSQAVDGSGAQTCHNEFKVREGCLPDQNCVEGSCILKTQEGKLKAGSYPFCANSGDCPDWQVCVVGRCYSTCTDDSTCSSGFKCHRFACRRVCNSTKNACSSDETCETKGSDEGVCVPKVSRYQPKPVQKSRPGGFRLYQNALSFSNHSTTGLLVIENKSALPASFEISRVSDSIKSKNPLYWLKFDTCKKVTADGKDCEAFHNKPSAAEPFKIPSIGAGKKFFVRVVNAAGQPKDKTVYQGVFLVKGRDMGEENFSVDYRATGDGQWLGKMVSFASFNARNIERMTPNSTSPPRDFSNALLRRWVNYKQGDITWEQFQAVLRSVREDSWKLRKVQEDCKKLFSGAGADAACYPYSSSKGYEILAYSQKEAPVPSGISELDFAIHVKEKGNALEGRIATSKALHYPGNPKISIRFAKRPGSEKKQKILFLNSTILVGGRYTVGSQESCPASQMEKVTIPWLLPDFFAGATKASQGLFREKYACRDAKFPMVSSKSIPAAVAKQFNLSSSAANPIPNGWRLRRKLELVDGVLIENRYIFALFRERFVSFFRTSGQSGSTTLSKDFVHYGYLLLEKTSADLKPEDFVAGVAPAEPTCRSQSNCQSGEICVSGLCKRKSQLRQVACAPEVVKKAIGTQISSHQSLFSWTKPQLNQLLNLLLDGQEAKSAQKITQDQSGEFTYTLNGKKRYVHYLCVDGKISFFNGGSTGQKECPVGSKVIFFDIEGKNNASMKAESCQTIADQMSTCYKDCLKKTGADRASCESGCPLQPTCFTRFQQLQGTTGFRQEVPFQCASANAVFCDTNRKDLRKEKVFFQAPTSGHRSNFNPLRIALTRAFRYRFQFTSRSGSTVGFSPSICQTNASATPYCYNPGKIEEIEQRVNCIQAIYTNKSLRNKLYTTTKNKVYQFLEENFSYTNFSAGGSIQTRPGFESLNAELKIMLGDEAYTKAFASRYDLAGSRLTSFPGDKLEPNGLQLSGALGYEMHNLYLSTQYYQLVLERFFSQTSVLFQSFQESSPFIKGKAVSSYFQKLLLASTRKARSWGQIARRYHELNRPKLARHVVERAYATTYMEKMILSRLLQELKTITMGASSKELAQLESEINTSSLMYKSALFDMQESYQKLSLDMNFFGYPKGYIPFPALSSLSAARGTTNAFKEQLIFTKKKLSIAKEKEEVALVDKRSYDTDLASFQSELARVDKTYESQLIELCGAMEVDNRIYPAIPKYAYLTPGTMRMGNPCGKLKTGSIYKAIASLEKIKLQYDTTKISISNLLKQVDIEKKRVQQYCNSKFELAQISWDVQGKKANLEAAIKGLHADQATFQRLMMSTMMVVGGASCSNYMVPTVPPVISTDCANKWGVTKTTAKLIGTREAIINPLNDRIKEKEEEIRIIDQKVDNHQIKLECGCQANDKSCQFKTLGTARIQSDVKLAKLRNQILQSNLNLLQAEYDIRIAVSRIVGMQLKAKQLITQQQEAQQLSVNSAAAYNSPNVRIYKNDAILNAERTFSEALRAAYRATLLYEYHTGQSYQRKGNLFLVRMVGYGDINLETYLSRLERSYREFESHSGRASPSVMVISLRDDILGTQKTKDGVPLTLAQRIASFQEALSSRERLNSEGYTSFPFSISVDKATSRLSPKTTNHKILYVEAEIIGSNVGDTKGRLYLSQKGTSVLRLPNNQMAFYSLSPQTAILNTYFNGSKLFEPAVYRSYRFRDRPVGNSHWELTINQVSEQVNKDIDLNSINDIKLYIYYTDFTEE